MKNQRTTGQINVQSMISILEEQLHHYRQLKSLSDRQRDLITREDPQELLALLGERQHIVHKLTNLSQKLAPIQEYWTENYQSLAPVLRREVDDLLEQVSKTLQHILRADEEDARILTSRKSQTAQQAAALTIRRQASRAYTQGTLPARRHLIKTDESA